MVENRNAEGKVHTSIILEFYMTQKMLPCALSENICQIFDAKRLLSLSESSTSLFLVYVAADADETLE